MSTGLFDSSDPPQLAVLSGDGPICSIPSGPHPLRDGSSTKFCDSSSLQRVQFSHNKSMKRNSKQCLDGAIAKRKKELKVPLCDLPMDVLSHILSYLPINDAIRTSVLSRKWKYMWRGHTNLTFNWLTMSKHYYGALRDTEFIKRVDAVLHQHCGRGIEHIEIKFKLHKKYAEYIDRWVDFAVTARTKKLTIDLFDGHRFMLFRKLIHDMHRPREEMYNIPSKLFDCDIGSYVQYLALTSVSLQPPANFKGFLNLKNLTLADVTVTDQDVQCMLSRCIVLEFFVTSIRISHPLSHFKHLVVDKCPLLQVIELNCIPMTLEYTGIVILIQFASTFRLTNVCFKLSSHLPALYYIITGFPATLPSLENLTLKCSQNVRELFYLRGHSYLLISSLRLELVLNGNKKRKTDVLDYAYLLEVAPFMELHMWMNCRHQPYHEEDDQVELAPHILWSSIVLEKMEINPKVEMAQCGNLYERTAYVDGDRVATEFICKADHRNVVEVKRPSVSWEGPIGYSHGRDGNHATRADSRRRGRLSCQGRFRGRIKA